jgi:hypothetical protein
LLTHIGRIGNRFLTIGTISKGKSSGRPPVSDEILEDLKEISEFGVLRIHTNLTALHVLKIGVWNCG